MLIPGFVLRMKRRWVENGLPDYPMWIAAVIDSAALASAVLAVVMRGTDGLALTVGLVVLAGLPWPLELWWQGRTWPAFVVLTGGGTLALMVLRPVEYDVAPMLLTLATGHVVACAGVWRGLAVLVTSEAVVIGLAVAGNIPVSAMAIWAGAIVAALDIGYVMRAQQLRIEAQDREHEVRERQAVLEERQRVAREVHDLVGHSLSVTMLHLTAARRDLEDAAAGTGAVADALDALTEAERVGRRAMADIRSTVGLLSEGPEAPAATAPTPTLADLPVLVAEYERAGLDVHLETRGDLADVPPATGLGLYRIVQESLANVAKHAPSARALVRLDLAGSPCELVVANELPRGLRRNSGGSGLRGMAARAQQLGAGITAGPEGRDWVVRVALPRGDETADHPCPLPRLTAPFRRAVQEPS